MSQELASGNESLQSQNNTMLDGIKETLKRQGKVLSPCLPENNISQRIIICGLMHQKDNELICIYNADIISSKHAESSQGNTDRD
jgi:hypothetical protein